MSRATVTFSSLQPSTPNLPANVLSKEVKCPWRTIHYLCNMAADTVALE